MQWLGIISLSVACCTVYGILHDQVTARVCIEYFTIGHPPIFSTRDPTLLGIGWGIIATWWVGIILGVPLAMASRLGTAPRKSTAQLLRPLAILMLVSGLFATLMGTIGFIAAHNGWVYLTGDLANRVPPEKHVAFITDLWAHSASYFAEWHRAGRWHLAFATNAGFLGMMPQAIYGANIARQERRRGRRSFI
ncbi:hypothetical protein [Roseimaritima sediminicola]|uniref:hypothetical protein n=1 Tax=Roseimaritima sediminicola TaxID=2662066 RepID=UPI001298248D|nr:hypothetical protein [Roseimaritima sediminicola]